MAKDLGLTKVWLHRGEIYARTNFSSRTFKVHATKIVAVKGKRYGRQ